MKTTLKARRLCRPYHHSAWYYCHLDIVKALKYRRRARHQTTSPSLVSYLHLRDYYSYPPDSLRIKQNVSELIMFWGVEVLLLEAWGWLGHHSTLLLI